MYLNSNLLDIILLFPCVNPLEVIKSKLLTLASNIKSIYMSSYCKQ